MSICPEHDYRSNLSDQEFWGRVAANLIADTQIDYNDEDLYDQEEDFNPCTICGSSGACGYDIEGRPMIHLEDDRSDVSDEG
jgi:hypothetical protein